MPRRLAGRKPQPATEGTDMRKPVSLVVTILLATAFSVGVAMAQGGLGGP